jgi:5-formyltetrahydrofolate cyclo-ligase
MEIQKKTLRTEIRGAAVRPSAEASAAIRSSITSLGCWRSVRTVLTYHPLQDEVDLLPLIQEENAKEWIFPRMDGEALSLHGWSPGVPWAKGAFGIFEPDPEHWSQVDDEAVDLALIPGLAFDREGHRLGRGKGFYDRLLARSGFRALRIGIVTERFLLRKIPSEPHDLRMDLVVTESAVHTAQGSRLDKDAERG